MTRSSVTSLSVHTPLLVATPTSDRLTAGFPTLIGPQEMSVPLAKSVLAPSDGASILSTISLGPDCRSKFHQSTILAEPGS